MFVFSQLSFDGLVSGRHFCGLPLTIPLPVHGRHDLQGYDQAHSKVYQVRYP